MEIKSGSNRRQLVLLGVLIVSIAITAYIWFGGALGLSGSDIVVIDSGVAGGGTVVQSADALEILAAIQILNTLNLDTEFFNDPKLRSLEEVPYSIPRVDPPGRRPLTELLREPQSTR